MFLKSYWNSSDYDESLAEAVEFYSLQHKLSPKLSQKIIESAIPAESMLQEAEKTADAIKRLKAKIRHTINSQNSYLKKFRRARGTIKKPHFERMAQQAEASADVYIKELETFGWTFNKENNQFERYELPEEPVNEAILAYDHDGKVVGKYGDIESAVKLKPGHIYKGENGKIINPTQVHESYPDDFDKGAFERHYKDEDDLTDVVEVFVDEYVRQPSSKATIDILNQLDEVDRQDAIQDWISDGWAYVLEHLSYDYSNVDVYSYEQQAKELLRQKI